MPAATKVRTHKKKATPPYERGISRLVREGFDNSLHFSGPALAALEAIAHDLVNKLKVELENMTSDNSPVVTPAKASAAILIAFGKNSIDDSLAQSALEYGRESVVTFQNS